MVDPRSDAELVRQARSDRAAFDALYRRYVTRVHRYVRARVPSDAVAEDVTSTVFLDALSGLPRYREQGRFAAWLFTIARRHVLDTTGRPLPRPVADIEAERPPEDEALELAAVRDALQDLTEDRRQALELRFFAGLSVRETAAVMGRGESAVKMLVHRGLAQLREALEEPGDG